MDANQVSRTALLTAYMRGYHAMHDSPTIFNDRLGYELLAQEERTHIEQIMPALLRACDPERAAACPNPAAALAAAMDLRGLFVSRARYTEDKLEEAVQHGVRQYVILGAGMDTFAFRRIDLLEQLHVFEIDHPATQSSKRSRIAKLGWKPPARLHFVPVDFREMDLAATLCRHAFDPKTVSFFCCLGVTYYLPRESVFAILRAVAHMAPAGSAIVFDYNNPDAILSEAETRRIHLGREHLKQSGEPFLSGFTPSALAEELSPLGLRLAENLSPSDIQGRYFQGRTDGLHALKTMHYACAMVT